MQAPFVNLNDMFSFFVLGKSEKLSGTLLLLAWTIIFFAVTYNFALGWTV